MLFRCCKRNKIQTVKIIKYYLTEKIFIPIPKYHDSNAMFKLELTMKDGSIRYESIEQRCAFKKYDDFFYNIKDQNYKHNQNILRKNHLLDLCDENVTPMREYIISSNVKCIFS